MCVVASKRKHWPEEIAKWYFAEKKIFGMLRDPYERLVAFFRGNYPGYGGNYPEEQRTCDVDAAVRKMMLRYMAGDIYAEGCTFLPQAEYFDAPFGITLAVDNRWFPDSANDLLAEHGYTNIHVATAARLVLFGEQDPQCPTTSGEGAARLAILICVLFSVIVIDSY